MGYHRPWAAPMTTTKSIDAGGDEAPIGAPTVPTVDERSALGLRTVVYVCGLAVVVIAAFIVRAIPLTNGLPYPSYIDEHFVLRPAALVYADRTWDPGFYIYPPFLIYATAVVALILRLLPGGSDVGIGATLDQPIRSNILSPDLILGGRLTVLVLSTATVLVVGLLARRLMGRRAGIVAAVLVASTPALVSRSAIVIVDVPAAFFATACLLCATYLQGSRRTMAWAVGGGAFAGLAAASKYTAGAAVLALVTVIALERGPTIVQKARLGVAALAGAGVTLIVAAPTVVLRAGAVLDETRDNLRDTYRMKAGTSYWQELLNDNEVGWVLLAATGMGAVVLVASRRTRPVTLGFGLYAIVLVGPLAAFPFQPFRNLVPLLPFLAVAAAAAVVRAVDGLGRLVPVKGATSVALAVMCALAIGAIMTDASWPFYRRTRIDLVDSRIEARRWFQANADNDDLVLVAAEIGFAPSELERIPGRVVVRSLEKPENASVTAGFDYVVGGDFPSTEPWRPALYDRRIWVSFGNRKTLVHPRSFRFPRQAVRVFGAPGTRDTSECFPLCG